MPGAGAKEARGTIPPGDGGAVAVAVAAGAAPGSRPQREEEARLFLPGWSVLMLFEKEQTDRISAPLKGARVRD